MGPASRDARLLADLLAGDAGLGEGQGAQPSEEDRLAAILAGAVFAAVDAADRILDQLQFLEVPSFLLFPEGSDT